jgi:hypothetical protein
MFRDPLETKPHRLVPPNALGSPVAEALLAYDCEALASAGPGLVGHSYLFSWVLGGEVVAVSIWVFAKSPASEVEGHSLVE